MADTSDLYTTVKNIDTVSRFHGYLGRHGKTLAANASTTVFGDLASQPGWNMRKQLALERDLLATRVTILSTPRAIILDTTPDAIVANPTVAATVAATGGGAGSSIAAGTYQVSYTFVSVWGETIPGGRSATFTADGTNRPRVTLPALPTNATSIRLYLSAVNLPTGTVKLYKTGITGTTTDLTAATYNDGTVAFALATAVPTVNTTQGPQSFGVKIADGTLGIVDPSWGAYRP